MVDMIASKGIGSQANVEVDGMRGIVTWGKIITHYYRVRRGMLD